MGLRNRIFKRDAGEKSSHATGDASQEASEFAAPAGATGEDQATMIIAAQDQPQTGGAAEPIEPSAGAYPPVAAQRPGFRERGRMRRRLRYLREVRELGFRDLGGLVFDQHRFQRPNEALVKGKVAAIDAADREFRAIGAALQERTPYRELFVPGVSACQRCGALHGSDARFCPHCGLSFGGPRFVTGVGAEQASAVSPENPATSPDPQSERDTETADPAAPPQEGDPVTPQAAPDQAP